MIDKLMDTAVFWLRRIAQVITLANSQPLHALPTSTWPSLYHIYLP